MKKNSRKLASQCVVLIITLAIIGLLVGLSAIFENFKECENDAQCSGDYTCEEDFFCSCTEDDFTEDYLNGLPYRRPYRCDVTLEQVPPPKILMLLAGLLVAPIGILIMFCIDVGYDNSCPCEIGCCTCPECKNPPPPSRYGWMCVWRTQCKCPWNCKCAKNELKTKKICICDGCSRHRFSGLGLVNTLAYSNSDDKSCVCMCPSCEHSCKCHKGSNCREVGYYTVKEKDDTKY